MLHRTRPFTIDQIVRPVRHAGPNPVTKACLLGAVYKTGSGNRDDYQAGA